MNILVLEFITSVGGVQTVYKNILPYLAKEHRVFFLDPYQNKFDNELLGISNLEVVKMPIDSPTALGWNKSYLNRCIILFKYGIIYTKYLYKLLKFIKDNQINLIYVSGKKEIAFSFLIHKILKIKYIYHSHGFNSEKDISTIYRIGIDSAEQIIAVSKNVKQILIQAKIKEEKVVIVYNGLNIEVAEEKCKDITLCDNPDKSMKIIFVGAIQPKKGLHILINAINILLAQGFDISLTIVGDITNETHKNYKEGLYKLTKKVNNKKFTFLGFQRNVFKYIYHAHLLVLPSVEESFGMVLIEAMYLSKPVIGSNIGGIPEVIVDGVNGLLFEPEDEKELAAKIKCIYEDRDLITGYGTNGREQVFQKFTSVRQATEIKEIINKM